MSTFGQNLVVVFAPVPVPSGWAPPVITFQIIDPLTPFQMILEGGELAAAYMMWHGALSQTQQNLSSLSDSHRTIAKKLSDLNIAIGAWDVAISMQTTLLATQASNQILTDNFFMAQSPNKPILPTPDAQLKENVINALTLTAGTTILSTTVSFVSDQAVALGTWITTTETYKSVYKWVADTYKTTAAPIVDSAKNKIRTGLGAIGLATPSQ